MPIRKKMCYNGRTKAIGNQIIALSGDEVLTYTIRQMEKGDLAQISEIDQEAFPSQWPPPNYRQELQNRLAHYLVAIDDTRTVAEAGGKEAKTQSKLSPGPTPW